MLSVLLLSGACFAKIVNDDPSLAVQGCKEQRANTDFSGTALCTYSNCPRVSSADECCTTCGSNSQCGAAVYFQGVCYLKSDASSPYSNSGRVGVIPGTWTPTATCTGRKADTDYSGGDMCSYSTCPRTASADDCCEQCRNTDGCVVGVYYSGICYMKNDASSPVASSGRTAMLPGPPPKRLGSFMVLGDWGYDGQVHGNVRPECQGLIGEAMQNYMKNNEIKFVLNLGDSFYPAGISSVTDPKWQDRWVKYYGKELTNLPWFSVYGNHDYEGYDSCGCTPDYSGCAQMHSGQIGGWFMPNMSFYDTRFEEELGIEIIALDTNYLDRGECCKYQHYCSQSQCHDILGQRMKVAMDLFDDRIAKSTAKNLLIINHYPSDYFHANSNGVTGDFLTKLRDNSKHHIEFFGGHRHNVDQSSVQNISPNNAWLVGGGGGWGCDGRQQGFVVGHVNEDFSISTSAVLVDAHGCCYNYQEGHPESVLTEAPPSAACVANPGCAKLDFKASDCCPNENREYHECCFAANDFPRAFEPFRNSTLKGKRRM